MWLARDRNGEMRYCVDCGYYIPGGGEHNCSAPRPRTSVKSAHVCALKEACSLFKAKEERDDVTLYPPIAMKRKRSRKRN